MPSLARWLGHFNRVPSSKPLSSSFSYCAAIRPSHHCSPKLANLSKSGRWQPYVMVAWALRWTCGAAITSHAHWSSNTVTNALLTHPAGASSTLCFAKEDFRLRRGCHAPTENSSIGLGWERKQLPHAHQTEPRTNKRSMCTTIQMLVMVCS